MSAPCDPPYVTGQSHVPHMHRHGVKLLGRIHRHGTRKLARRLVAGTGACLPGSRSLLFASLLPAVAPIAGYVALGAFAPTSIEARAGDPGLAYSGAGLYPAFGTGGIPARVVTTKTHHHKVPPVPVPEPTSLAILLLGGATWAYLRFGFRRA